MKTTFLPTTLAIALLAAPVARADGPSAHLRQAVAQTCHKDYSKNAVTGEYCRASDGIPTSSLAGTTSATAPAPSPSRPAAQAGGFSWGDAGIGAGAGFVLALGSAALVLAMRRPAHS